MSGKKTTILGIIAVVALGGMIYYFNQKANTKNQAASILDATNNQQAVDAPAGATLDEFVLGNPDAPVTMVEYYSHLCGHCISFHAQTLPTLVEKYVKAGQLKIVPRLLSPVELGLAMLCAQEKDKFTEMDNYLFEHVSELTSLEDLKGISEKIGLNKDEFTACFESKKYEAGVVKWFKQAEDEKIEGTPTFVINGQKIVGDRPLSEFEKVIDEELAKQ